MEAAKGPLWEFGPNRVKAVGGDPRILIDSANTHTLSTRRGSVLACMREILPRGPASVMNCWHAQHLAPGLRWDLGGGALLGTSCQRLLPWGDHVHGRVSRQDPQRAITAGTLLALPLCKWWHTTLTHPGDNWLGKASPRPAENKITRGW